MVLFPSHVFADEHRAVHKKFPTREAAEAFVGTASSTASQPYAIPNVPAAERAAAKKAPKGYYAVKVGLKPGVYDTWWAGSLETQREFAEHGDFHFRADVERMVKGIQGCVVLPSVVPWIR
jgi:hypothetical protein